MKKMHSLKVMRYAARLIDLNEYSDSFPQATIADKIGVTELNEIIWNSMPNSWSKQAYVQGFGCKFISFKKYFNMFEHMEIAEYICKGVLKPSRKNLPRHMPTVLVTSVIREENLTFLKLTPRW